MTTPLGITLSLDGAQKFEADARRVSGSVDNIGISAKQTAAALRGVPAQFTDIVTSLQGGQAPLTVFLQQGGQLKDMFGGAGNAAKALGGYVVGLINPFTVAAATGVALALAYKQGSAEADVYTKSIALTGNAAGVTTAQLAGMAARVSDVVGTQAKAADVLAQLVGTGNVASAALEQQAATAIRLERNAGIAVKDTVKEFAELGKEPVEAAKKLNERYNYLTASVYEQIKALKEQGKTQEAAALSQASYEKAMSTVADTLQGKLGYLERAWRAVGDGAAFAWDKMLNVGRGGAAADPTAEVRARLTRQQQELADKRAINPNADTSGMEKGIDVLKHRLGVLESDERMLRRGAAAQAARVQAEKAAIEATDELQKIQGKGLTQQQQMNKALEDYRKNLDATRAVNPGSATLSPDAIARGERAIREQFKAKGSGAASGGENEVAALRAQADAAEKYLEQLRATGVETEKLTAGEQRAAKIREELKTSINGSARAQKELALVEADRLGAAERSTVVQKALIKSTEESEAAYRKVLDAITKTGDAYGTQADQQEAANASLGRSKTAIEEAALAQQKLYLVNEKAAGPWDPERIKKMEYAIEQQNRYVESLRGGDAKALNARADELLRSATELSALYENESQLVSMSNLERTKTVALRQVELKYAKELADIDKSSATTDEARAAKQAARDKVLQAKRIEGEAVVAKAIQDDWTRTTDEINRSLTDALLRGFESGKGFAENLRDTLKNMFNTLVLRPIISAVLSPISGALGGLFGGGGGGAGGASGAGSLLNLAMGKNAYSLYSGGLSGLTAPGGMYYNFATSGIGQSLGLSNAAPILGNNVSAFAPAGTQLTSPFSGGMSAVGGAGVFAAVAALVLNAVGAFRSDRKVGGGLMGTLGKGELNPWEEWREGGTLFDGPSFSTFNPVAELTSRRARLQALKDSGQGDTQQAATLQVMIDALEEQYGDLAAQAAAQSKAIQTAYDALRTNVGDMADVLGLSSDAVRAFTTQLGGSGKGLNFDGLSAEEVQAKITEALATANNELAQQVIGTFVTETTRGTRIVSENTGSSGEDQNIVYSQVDDSKTSTRYVASQYAREGEQAIDTLTRLSTSLTTVNDVFETLGVTLLDASLAGADAASSLADAFGGLERFVAVTQDYYQTYYSEDERKAQMQGRLDKQFAELGIATPKNRDEFRRLADDALAQVEVQRANRASLTQSIAGAGKGGLTLADLGKSGILANVDPALYGGGKADPATAGKLQGFLQGVNDLVGKGLDSAEFDKGLANLVNLNSEVLGIGKDADKTAAAILGLSGTFAQLNESADEAAARIERDRAKAQDEAYNNFRRAIARDREALGEQASTLQASISSIRGTVDMLRSNARDILGTADPAVQAMAGQGRAYIDKALAGVRAGASVDDYTGLGDAVSAARAGLDGTVYRNQAERDYAAQVLAGPLNELVVRGETQLTFEERQLKLVQTEIDRLTSLDKRAAQLVDGTTALTDTVDTYFQRLLDILAPEAPMSGTNKPGVVGSGGAGGITWGGTSTPSKYQKPVNIPGGTVYVGVSKEEEKRLDPYYEGYHAFDGTGDAAGLNNWIASNNLKPSDLSGLSGLYEKDWEKWFRDNGIPGYANGGMHMGGLRMVGERGWELEATGPARYWNQQQLAGALGGAGADPALREEMRALREEVAALRAANEKAADAAAATADLLARVTRNGNGMITAAAPI